jgi:hypothetical protein
MMKMIFGALTLALAVPAVAQTTPVTAPDAHAQHQGMDHSKHGQAKHDCKDCCEKMKQSGGKMECMDKKGEAKPTAPSSVDHQAHEGHAH